MIPTVVKALRTIYKDLEKRKQLPSESIKTILATTLLKAAHILIIALEI